MKLSAVQFSKNNKITGGDERIRTADPLLARQVLSQLSYIPFFTFLVGLSGFEPLTSRLSGVRSNQLSYRPSIKDIKQKFEPANCRFKY